jgi:hypothetical protein
MNLNVNDKVIKSIKAIIFSLNEITSVINN